MAALFDGVHVDHDGFDRFVSHEFFDLMNGDAGFEQPRGEGMAQSMRADRFIEFDGLGGVLDLALDIVSVYNQELGFAAF